MTTTKLVAGGIYALSAPYSAGKSSIIERSTLPHSFVVSLDALRRQVMGSLSTVTGGEIPFEHADGILNDIMLKMIEARAAQRLTTIIDATNLTDDLRANYSRIAAKYGVQYKTLILDAQEDVALARNRQRLSPVPEQKVKESFTRFQRTSHLPFEILGDDAVLEITLAAVPHLRVDVIGDVHGLYDELVALMAKAGWTLDATGLPVHSDPTRLLLFLGDLIDRGQESLKVLRLVRRAVAAGVALCVKGNHEAKILRFWDQFTFKGVAHWSSFASAETGVALLKISREEAEDYVKFLREMPAFLVETSENIAFLHADVNRFDPLFTPQGDCLYGHSKQGLSDSDAVYQERFDAGLNQYTLMRGHRAQISLQENVFSLERDQAFKGELVLLPLDEFVRRRELTSNRQAFDDAVITQACVFDFDAHSEKFELAKAMDTLVVDKLAVRQDEPQFGLKVYRYHKRVFTERLWDENPYVVKARGLVLDVAGNIVTHPFDKVWIYGEKGAMLDIPDERQVVAVEKLNGFALNISQHPFKPNELLITTQGSFDGSYVEFGKAFVTPKVRGQLLRYLSRKDVTLMFEVLHVADPHIIEYAREDYGMYLLGVRGKEQDSMPWTESEVDSTARELGLRRPAVRRTSFGELRNEVRNSRTEGFMVREYSSDERHLGKLKSPFYLVTKFLGRLTNDEIAEMYRDPSSCKLQMDEQYRHFVDLLTTTHAQAEFSSMGKNNRIRAVRALFDAVIPA